MELLLIIVVIVGIVLYASKDERRVMRNVNKLIEENGKDSMRIINESNRKWLENQKKEQENSK